MGHSSWSMVQRSFVICACVLMQIICFTKTDDDLLVQTSTGPIRGMYLTGFTNKLSRVFLGIPYAQPPVGKLRFRPPLPVIPWTEVFDATKVPLPCYQTYTKNLLKMSQMSKTVVRRPWSENCLTLSIWTPVGNMTDIPSIVFFHEGGFNTGTGVYSKTDFSTYAAEAEILRVIFNYRLGAFGFLSLGTPEFSGNVGLMDQHTALKWIHQNIQEFRGKRSAIFLGGIEAGATSTGYIMMLDQNKGLYKTILQAGGSPTCSWTWQSKDKAVMVSKVLSRQLGCDHANTSRELECLQQAHPEDIVQASLSNDVLEIDQFKPNTDGAFIKENPIDAMRTGRFNNNTFVGYSTSQEGSLLFYALNEDLLKGHGYGLNMEGFKESIRRSGLAHSDTEISAIIEWYTRSDQHLKQAELRDAAVRAYSDGKMRCCSREFLDYVTAVGALTFNIVYGIPDPNLPKWIGAHHLAPRLEMTARTLDPRYNYPSEYKMAKLQAIRQAKSILREKASEFAKHAPLYNLEEKPYMLITSNKTYRLKNYLAEEFVLWNEILPAIRKNMISCDDN